MPATDAITLLVDDHRRVDALFDEYAAATDAAERERLVRTIMSELSIHAAVEELFLYPVVREVVPGGADQADESLEEHQQIKDVLATLEELGVEAPEFRAKMDELVADVRHHVGEEEAELFPSLREAIGDDRLTEMGAAIAAGKAMAPTHPHPELPNRPPANFIVGPVAGVADRVRDGLEALGDEGQWTELVRQGQQAVWDVVRTWADAATRGTPSMGSVASQWRPDDAVERVFDFSNRLLQMQRQFAKDLFGAVGGAGEQVWEEASSAAPSPEQAATASAPRTASRARASAEVTTQRSTAERPTAKQAPAKRSTAQKAPPAKQSPAKQSTGKQSTAKRSTAKQTPAKRSSTAQTSSRASGETSSGGRSADALRDQTVDELQQQARQADVEGRSQMDKDELVDALAADGGGGSQGGGSRDYGSMTVAELRDEAKRVDVPGRTGMNKAQLVRALQQRSG